MTTAVVVDSNFVLALIFIGLGLVSIGMRIGYWIGTIPQRAAAKEAEAEKAYRHKIWVEGQRDPDFEDTTDYG